MCRQFEARVRAGMAGEWAGDAQWWWSVDRQRTRKVARRGKGWHRGHAARLANDFMGWMGERGAHVGTRGGAIGCEKCCT